MNISIDFKAHETKTYRLLSFDELSEGDKFIGYAYEKSSHVTEAEMKRCVGGSILFYMKIRLPNGDLAMVDSKCGKCMLYSEINKDAGLIKINVSK